LRLALFLLRRTLEFCWERGRIARRMCSRLRQDGQSLYPVPMRTRTTLFIAVCLLLASPALFAQFPLDPSTKPAPTQDLNPLTNPSLSPEIQFLYQLEAKFAADTAKGGGKSFASWFADDAVTLSNGKAPVVGRAAIAATATWSPADYQLTWTPEGARLSPAGDMGFTWGHYEGRAKDRDGNPIKTTGRYMTVWKKQSDNSWKVALDASNDAPPAEGDCCRLP
jgi:ketosteroid isomerase-like protein